MRKHFIIVGAQRSGTTGLYRLLDQHPDICMARPIKPEPKFFLRKDALVQGYENYLALHFPHHTHELALGEKSTSYIEHENAIANIHRTLPEAHLIFVLRDPATRAYSNWRFSRANGIEDLGFVDALEAEETRTENWDHGRFSVCPYAYAGRGHYPRYLERWARCFPRENMILVTSELLFNDLAVVRHVLERIGVDPGVPLQLPGKVNESAPETDASTPRSFLQRLRIRYEDDIRTLADEWGLDTTPWRT